jgi:hypothetical protein
MTRQFETLYARRGPLKTWDEVVKVAHEAHAGGTWVFRGLPQSDYKLESTIERALVCRFQIGLTQAAQFEDRILREFKRHLHRYTPGTPPDTDHIEWLALMRHCGAPTRLLDWTYSFWIAVYFALEKATIGQTCSIWGIDYTWWSMRFKRCYPRLPVSDLEIYNHDKAPKSTLRILNSGKPGVIALNSFRFSERHAVQQGIFLAATDIRLSFAENLSALSAPTSREHFFKLGLQVDKDLLSEGLRQLKRMNIHRLSLFPGIDGLAQGLENLFSMPETLGIK